MKNEKQIFFRVRIEKARIKKISCTMRRMMYVIALGNPGPQYDGTRHNIGFALADMLITYTNLDALRVSARYHGRLTEGVWDGSALTVLCPDTFMNKSGLAAAALVPRDRRSEAVVVHDDVALPLGKVRVSKSSGAGGHNGVQSIIDSFGSNDFVRIRLGVGVPPPEIPLERYVLARFTADEQSMVQELIQKGLLALRSVLVDGVEVAMRTYN